MVSWSCTERELRREGRRIEMLGNFRAVGAEVN